MKHTVFVNGRRITWTTEPGWLVATEMTASGTVIHEVRWPIRKAAAVVAAYRAQQQHQPFDKEVNKRYN